MASEEFEKAIEQSSMRLLQVSCPPVRYWLLKDVMGKDREDALMKRAVAECEDYPPRVKLLQALREDGTWPISKQRKAAEDGGPGPPIGWTYTTMLRNLHALLQYRTSRDEGNVRAALELIFSWQTKEGYIPGPWTDAFPLTHYNGYAVHDLCRFELSRDKRVRRIIGWLEKSQRSDGGWIIPFLMDVRSLPEYSHMKFREFIDAMRHADKTRFEARTFPHIPSCIWTTMQVVWGLVEDPRSARSASIRRGADFFLDRFFTRNYHKTFYYSETNWTRLKYPPHFGSGLSALDTLTRLGYGPDDPRMDRPIRWLLSVRSRDGFWSQSERPNPEKDQWITVTALRILRSYSDRM